MTFEPELIEENIEEYLARQEQKELLRFLTCGSVDDGKSTLIGRLLHDSKLIYEDQLAAIKQASSRKGLGDAIDLSLLLDGLAAEREQGITIDVAYRYFSTSKRKFIIADTPGHEQYTRNMATGASNCDLAVILVDARKGVLAQTRRHSFIVSLLGIRHLVVAVNKMDLVEYSEEVFENIKRDYTDFAAVLGVDDIHFVPLSALNGDNVVDESEHMPWYQGGALLPYLETVYIAADRNMAELRMPVQWVSRPDANFRGFAGSIASGVLRPGDDILVLPTGTTSKVKSIVTFDGDLEEACPPQAITVTLEDEIDISRGDMIVSPEDRPRVERDFDAFLVWMSEDAMRPGTQYLFKQTHNLVRGTISSCRYAIDVNTLKQHEADGLALNEIGRCQVSLNRAIPLDAYRNNRTTGAFIVIDRITNNTVGAGVVIDHFASDEPRSLWEAEAPSELLQRKTSSVTPEERHSRFGQFPATLLLTGLTASGKSTVAYALERRLFDAGHAAAVLDGETMRLGISKDLGFSLAERSENLRRAAEVARMQNEAGLITICAFVAPDRESREQTRQMIGDERFVEVYLSAPVEVCRERDTHGMYARADSGEIEHFPGVTEPYEAPESPDLELPTHLIDVDTCVDQLMRLLEQRGYLR